MARVWAWVQTELRGQQVHLFPWVPVLLACGIGLYFTLRWEPPLWSVQATGAAVVFLWSVLRRLPDRIRVLGLGLSLVSAGFALAGARAHMVAGPVLEFRYYGAIEGRIVGIDRSASDATRLTLDRVIMERMDPARTPRRVRVSLHGQQGFAPLQPGATVILTGHLSGPQGAVEPGGFDFRRHAWFLRLGAVGYTRSPVMLLEPPGAGQWVFKTRMALSERVRQTLEGETGAFAAAVMTGDRSGMGQDTLQALRDSNLAHLLAISGLHMGLLAGFVFAALRLYLLLVPHVRHHWPVKQIAALGALVAAGCYLALSGGNVATQRAFVMVAVALGAVLVDRRALSLRAVALAALIVLVLRPEALLGPGFQMSFAATVALVAIFEKLGNIGLNQRVPRWLTGVLSLVISSAVAGAATAPIGMAHFNQAAHYGLLANLVSVPVMGLVIVPLAVLAALLLPLGLEAVPLWMMGQGLDWILAVAQGTADLPGAVGHVAAPPALVLPMLALGGLWLCLWRGWGRIGGVLPCAIAIALWASSERPEVLIASDGALVGVMTGQGRALSRERGAGFVARTWLENDGSGVDQPMAATLWPSAEQARVARIPFGDGEVIHLQGKTGARDWRRCGPRDIVVSNVPLALSGPCTVFDSDRLGATGAVAILTTQKGPQFHADLDVTGRRLWHAPLPDASPSDQ